MRRRMMVAKVVLACLALLPCGCFAPERETNLYLLESSADGTASAASEGDLTLGLGPVTVPTFLDRPQLMTREGRNRIRLEVFDQWAEPLQENLTRVLAEDLRALTGATRVLRAPFRQPTDVDLRIAVEVTRFESTDGGDCLLVACWSVAGEGVSPTMQRNTRLAGKASSEEIPAVVACLNGLVGELSREIAAEVVRLAGRP